MGGSAEFELSTSKTTVLTTRTDIMYIQKGWITEPYQYSEYFGKDQTVISVNEIVIAPFLVFRFLPDGISPFLQMGPEIGFNVVREEKVILETQHSFWGFGVDTEPHEISWWNSRNLGFNIGAGVVIPDGHTEVTLDVRYNMGLIEMESRRDISVRTNGFQVFLGYNFSTPRKFL